MATIKKRSNKSRSSSLNKILYFIIVCAIFTILLSSHVHRKLRNQKKTFETTKITNPTTTTTTTTTTHVLNNAAIQNAPTIAYIISITSCSNEQFLIDGAAVLRHSIYLQSIQNPNSSSRYNYEMLAIIHPQVINDQSCGIVEDLDKIGYEIHIRDVPVPTIEIEGDYLRNNVESNGCCGEKEFIKLWSLSFDEYPVVVHLDLDTVVFRPLDALFDLMLLPESSSTSKRNEIVDYNINGNTKWTLKDGTVQPMWVEKEIPSNVEAYFTRDYNMANPSRKDKHVGVQGGLFIAKPNQAHFEEFKSIIKKGDFQESTGWGGLRFGPFYGAMTFQGILPYFYDALHPNSALELNRCFYNVMADNPRVNPTVNNVVSGKCRDGREDCEDCREMDVKEVVTAHFTLCQKPWLCLPHDRDLLQDRLCRKMHQKWFEIRADLEGGNGSGRYDPDQFYGFCKGGGHRNYIQYQNV